MSFEALAAPGIVLLVAVSAFVASAAIGLMVGRLRLDERDELDDSRAVEPASHPATWNGRLPG